MSLKVLFMTWWRKERHFFESRQPRSWSQRTSLWHKCGAGMGTPWGGPLAHPWEHPLTTGLGPLIYKRCVISLPFPLTLGRVAWWSSPSEGKVSPWTTVPSGSTLTAYFPLLGPSRCTATRTWNFRAFYLDQSFSAPPCWLAVLSCPGNYFLPSPHAALSPFRSQLKCHLFAETFPGHLNPECSPRCHPQALAITSSSVIFVLGFVTLWNHLVCPSVH